MEVGGPHPCVAALVYIYDRGERELPKPTRDFHQHHDLAQATLHVHLNQESYMEVTVLTGCGYSDVQRFTVHVIAERGVMDT